MEQYKKTRITTLIFYLILYTIWALLECGFVPLLETHLTQIPIEIIMEIVLKTLLWFIPAFIILRKHGDSMYLSKSEITGSAGKIFTFIPMYIFILLFSAFLLISNYSQNGKIVISPSFHPAYFLIVIFIAVTEEMVFRGTLLNTALKKQNQWIAFSGNALMFLMIHFPIWLREGVFTTYITSFAFLQLIALSFIFSWTFAKSRSIIVPVILHAYWDLMCFAIA